MAQKSSYTDVVHFIVKDSVEPLSLNEIVTQLTEREADNPPKNPRASVRSALRSSGLIKAVGKDQYDWISRIVKGARLRVTLHPLDFAEKSIHWDTDALIAQWPAVEEPETRRTREPVSWQLDGGPKVTVELAEVEEAYKSRPDAGFWNWLDESGAKAGDDLILTAVDPENHSYAVSHLSRVQRNTSLVDERNKVIKRKTDTFLQTQRDNMAKPREIVSSLLASKAYHDSVPPQGISNLLPKPIKTRYGAAVPADKFRVAQGSEESNVIPFPSPKSEESVEGAGAESQSSSVALDIPFNTGRELPDDKNYIESLDLLRDGGAITPALAIHVLNVSRMCSPAYALLSQTAEYRKEALDLAGQSVVAAERRIAHGLVESLITGEEFSVEVAVADYLESRSFLARALWHGGNQDDAIEQAMHCFEVDPEDPSVREDLFVMLFDTDRHEMVIRLLESFPGASVTEDLYHKALAALSDDPDSKDSKRALRKSVSHNPHLASLFLGEEPKKSKRSSIDEAVAYESAYGFLWRREDFIFDMLEEIVLAKR